MVNTNSLRKLLLHLLVPAALLVFSPLSAAPGDSSGPPYQLTPSLNGGGGPSSGGPYSLTATIGQPDTAVSQADATRLQAGFWSPVGENLLFKDSFEGVSP